MCIFTRYLSLQSVRCVLQLLFALHIQEISQGWSVNRALFWSKWSPEKVPWPTLDLDDLLFVTQFWYIPFDWEPWWEYSMAGSQLVQTHTARTHRNNMHGHNTLRLNSLPTPKLLNHLFSVYIKIWQIYIHSEILLLLCKIYLLAV